MGFIDWHGNKQDPYEEVLEFAKMKEKMEADNFGSQMKKKADAKFFGVPELLPMENDEILKLLLKEKKCLDMLYDVLVQSSKTTMEQLHIDLDMANQFYQDFLRYSMDVLFQHTKMEEKRIHQFTDVLLTKIFKVKNQISGEEHYQRIKTCAEYRQYLSLGFELKSGAETLFWQWICYLSELSGKRDEGSQFIKLYQRFMMHLSYYINQLVPNADVGKRYRERREVNADVLQNSVSTKIDLCRIEEKIRNPIFRIHAEEEKRRQEAEQLAARRKEEAERIAAEEEIRRQEEAEAHKQAEREEAERKRQAELEAEAQRKKWEPEPVNMEQLTIGFLEKEDMEAYILGIKTMMDSGMSEKLKAYLSDLLQSLECLDIALKKYPSYKEQSYNFFSYYIPETVKILYAYQEYEKAGLGEQEINPVYDKVVTAIQKLSAAAKQQVADIYKKAIMDTTARADALTEILGQDGFVDPAHKING